MPILVIFKNFISFVNGDKLSLEFCNIFLKFKVFILKCRYKIFDLWITFRYFLLKRRFIHRYGYPPIFLGKDIDLYEMEVLIAEYNFRYK